jgi:hypothetical protein
MLFDNNKPITLSASLIDANSGVITTKASLAAAIAIRNPSSTPAGESISI